MPPLLTGFAAVRKRPGMYIGDTEDGNGLHHMLWEVVSNAVDEHLAGHCRHVKVVLERDGSVLVDDDGRGISLEKDASGLSFAERVVASLHATPTRDGHYPHTHVGPNGVGLAVVNALSEAFELEVRRDGSRWAQRFRRGVAVTRFARRGSARRSGTSVRFRPDREIFAATELSYDLIRHRLAELAALSAGLSFDLRDQRRRRAALRAPQGLAEVLAFRSRADALRIQAQVDETRVDVVLNWFAGGPPEVSSFVNMQRTREGSHVDGLLAGLADAVQAAHPSRPPRRVARSAVEAGLRAAVHVIVHGNPRFGNPTKDRLDEPEVGRTVRRVVATRFGQLLALTPALKLRLTGHLPG